MCGAAEGNDCKDSYGYCKEMVEMEGQGDKAEADSGDELCGDDKEFLCLEDLRNGLHRNFIVQGNIMTDVHKAIWLSSIPSPLNMSTQTIFSITNGIPIAKYALGTHVSGECFCCLVPVIGYC